jgi:hypothetical protein
MDGFSLSYRPGASNCQPGSTNIFYPKQRREDFISLYQQIYPDAKRIARAIVQ